LPGLEGIEVVSPWIVQHDSRGSLRLFGPGAPKALESVAEDAAQGLLDDVPRDVSGSVKGAFALAAAYLRLELLDLGYRGDFERIVQLGLELLQVIDGMFEDVAQDLDVDQPGIRDNLMIRDR